jgi:hypothetical protein
MRSLSDERGERWEAVADPVRVAHLRDGARLAFRSGAPDGATVTVTTPVDFNSMAAAEMAIRTMSENELRRRLAWAKTSAGLA